MKKKDLVAVLAVRNAGSRLYGKPIQNIDIEDGISILDVIIKTLKNQKEVDDIVLAIAEGVENQNYIDIANKNSLKYVVGSEKDVLKRLLLGAKKVNAKNILRITSESPFPYLKPLKNCFQRFKEESLDALFYDNIIDGCGFEIISYQALKKSHEKGDEKHRSEFCTLYLRENIADFKILKVEPQKEFQRFDLRFTVDYPEDLIVCRNVYTKFKNSLDKFPLLEMINFLDNNKNLKELIYPYTESGYSTMYL